MLEDIYAFCTIAKHKSFSKAAREIGISTPVITRRIVRLEQLLDARLLNRTTRQVTLTEAGNLFYSEVSDILQALEASKESVKSLTSQVSGTLKVGIPTSLNQSYIAPAFGEFIEKYPNLKVHLISGNSLLDLLNNGFDLVFQCGELPHSSYYYKKVITMKKVFCASPEYLKKRGIPTTLADLSQHNCLEFTTLHQTWTVSDKGKPKEIIIEGNVQTNDAIVLKQLAKTGVGISYLPAYFIHEELMNGQLVSILEDATATDYSIYAVYPTKKYIAKKTQIFIDFVTTLLEKKITEKEAQILA